MRLPATILILVFFLPEVTTNMHDEKEKQKVLAQNSLLKMEISSESRAEFLAYMSQFCLTEMSTTEFLNKYITWENVEFMDAVKDFLEPSNSDRETVDAYFHHLGHSFMTNCTIKNDKQIRDAHDAITSDTLFDNYMYDMMTRNQWTGLNL